jgi:hypothetical protein
MFGSSGEIASKESTTPIRSAFQAELPIPAVAPDGHAGHQAGGGEKQSGYHGLVPFIWARNRQYKAPHNPDWLASITLFIQSKYVPLFEKRDITIWVFK